MSSIEQRLRETIGLDAGSVGVAAIQRAIRLEMKRLGFQSTAAYAQWLASSPTDWAELVDAVVVTETWFFRDEESFAALTRFVQDEWLPANETGVLRLLSVPCASGEEPYSVVMALVDAGVPPGRAHIEAADISARELARARLGIYGKNSFRSQQLGFRQRHFFPYDDRFALDAAIRSSVRFERGNLLDESFGRGKGHYDVIFCRNLLIYFDGPARTRALARLAGLLSPAGLLFVAPAEQPLALAHGFVSAGFSQGCACRKPPVAPAVSEWRPAAAGQANPPPTLLPAESSRSLGRSEGKSLAPERIAPRSADAPSARSIDLGPRGRGVRAPAREANDLEQARRLADAGRLVEAAALCEQHLSQSPASAQAYYLLGLVREVGGDARADDCYRKALYLDPNHYETLMHVALLAEKRGDLARADVFRRRARRLQVGEQDAVDKR